MLFAEKKPLLIKPNYCTPVHYLVREIAPFSTKEQCLTEVSDISNIRPCIWFFLNLFFINRHVPPTELRLVLADTAVDKTSANGTTNSNTPPTTVLAKYLATQNITPHKLAQLCEVTPRAVYALVGGQAALVAPKTLIAISDYTRLSIDALVRPYADQPMATDTGSRQVNHILAKIGRYLHKPNCEEELAAYIHPEFRCSGHEYQVLPNSTELHPTTTNPNSRWINWSEMCAANTLQSNAKGSPTTTLLSATWYTPRGQAPHDATILHTYWQTHSVKVPSMRAKGINPNSTSHTIIDSIFTVLEFDRSVAETQPIQTAHGLRVQYPLIRSWWWHQPRELALAAEYAGKRYQSEQHQMEPGHMLVNAKIEERERRGGGEL